MNAGLLMNEVLVALVVGTPFCVAMGQTRPVGAKYAFWPPPPAEPRVQFLKAFGGEEAAEAGKALKVSKPYGVAMHGGRVFVCDVRSGSVTVIDLAKGQTRAIRGEGDLSIKDPADVALADDGSAYVLDAKNKVIQLVSAEEKLGERFALPADALPISVTVHKDRLFVADVRLQRVLVLDRRTGKHERTIGKPGAEDGEFIRPMKAACDRAGNVFVSDALKARVHKFSPDGKLLLAFGQPGEKPGCLMSPKHLCVDAEGLTYVVDAGSNTVQVFGGDGKWAGAFGSAGPHPGALNLPAGICVHEGDVEAFKDFLHPAFEARRLVVVTNQFGPNKVSVYAVGKLRPGCTVKDIAADAATVPGVEVPATSPAVIPAGR